MKIVTGPQQGGSGSTLAQLKTEGANTQVSLVLFGQALGRAIRDADLLQLFTPANADQLRRAPAPLYAVSYDDPTTSASGLIVLVGAIRANGGTIQNADPGFAYLQQIKPQVATYNLGGAGQRSEG